MDRKICFLVCVLCLPFLLFACAEKQEFLPQFTGDFVCFVSGEIEGKPIAATVYADGRAVYTAPEVLAGVVALADGETVVLGEMELPASSLGGLFLPSRLICDAYEITGSGTEGKGGACFVDGANAHGRRRVYVDEDGTPCRISGSFDGLDATLELRWQSFH